jgi:lipopolysaccharide transport system permease protein
VRPLPIINKSVFWNIMQEFPITFKEMVICPYRNRYLIRKSIQREVLGRYRGSILGVLWSFLTPLFMLAVYTFVFGVVFQARWNIANNSRVEYALILFSGLIAFNIFAECVNKAPRMVVDNSEYVKKVIYPLEILPIIALGESIFYAAVSLLVWLAAYLALFGLPHLAILTLPIVLAPLCLFILGICWALAALGVYFRDISQFINILTTGLLLDRKSVV